MKIPIMTTTYTYSPEATKKSTLGTILIAVGIPTLFAGIGIVLIIIGVVMKLRAKSTAEKESFSNWIRSLEEKGVLNNISEDTALGVELYRANPCQDTLDYLRKVNPKAAELVDPLKNGKCELCDKENVPVFNAKIVDEMGTRYRCICKECFDKTHATSEKP